MTKYIFVTGGVVSSLGKGIASASLGTLLEARGYKKIAFLKLDPYINVDPGTMNPFQHGEVYVTEDGAETDRDLGHYERFTSLTLSLNNNSTSGQVYNSVIKAEREGVYLGGTIQVIPHITNEIKKRIKNLARAKKGEVNIIITEIGGTVGDIESLPFLEAIRQFRLDKGRENVLYIHLTLVPYVHAADELKTKPTQHSVGRLREIGIQPDILLCRTERPLSKSAREKIGLFCNIKEDAVIEARDSATVYEIPLIFREEGLDRIVLNFLHLKKRTSHLEKWEKMVDVLKNPKKDVSIAVVGKYVKLQDAYKSIYEALTHGGIANFSSVKIIKVDSEKIEKEGAEKYLKNVDGILVPGGFGTRGIEGMIAAITYAREKKIPFLGICLGMQCAVIEFARNVGKLKKANSTEFNKETPYPVISLLTEQKKVKNLGGTMRLGAYPCRLLKNSLVSKIYQKKQIRERHRHRYEFNSVYREILEKKGLRFSGFLPGKKLVEIIEIPEHPFFIGTQFHPEFKSRPLSPHPLFSAFIRASLKNKKE